MIRKWYPHVVSTIALVVALTMGGAYAAQHVIGSKQIKNGSITSADLAKGAVHTADIGKNQVKSADIASGGVTSSDIGRGQVTSSDIGTGQVTSGAIGAGQVTSSDIADGQVDSSDIGAGQVGSPQIGDGAVKSNDIGDGEVTPDDITLPPPATLAIAAGEESTANPTGDYVQVVVAGRYNKQVEDSQLQVSWTGSAAAGFTSCIFQLRVDGQPSGRSTGESYVANGGQALSVSSTALFEGIPRGEHTVEIWAKIPGYAGGTYPCTVGPAQAGIGQTVVVTEALQ